MRKYTYPCAAAALALAAHGCATDTPRTDGLAVRDSAGIAIVESAAALEDRPLAALADSTPVADIGTLDGPAEYQLYRVNSGAILPDGRIAIANAASQEIRFYDSAGRFLSSAGRRGEGPGEYQYPTLVPSPHADSLFVNDPFPGRLSVLTADGVFVRAVTRRFGDIAGVLDDGRVVTTGNTATASPDSPEGVITNRVVVVIAKPEPNDADTLGLFDGPDLFLSNQDGRFAFTAAPFDVRPTAAVLADRVLVTPGRIPEIREYDAAGSPLRILRVLREPVPVTGAMVDAFVERQLATVKDANEAAEYRRRYRNAPTRESVPAYQRLLVDAAGRVWAEHFREDRDASSAWSVFDDDGMVLGTVTLPERARLLAVGHGLVVAARRDSLDVEHVVAWRLAL